MNLPLFPWLNERSSGLLLHPTSLPSELGIGNFGREAYRLVDFLADSHIRYWQICPLGPTGFGDSPYQCFSAFAGNPYLIDLTALVERGLLEDAELDPLRKLPVHRVDYGNLYLTFWPIIRTAAERFREKPDALEDYGNFEKFKDAHSGWLYPYALFQALKAHFQGKPWFEWPQELRTFQQARGNKLIASLETEIEDQQFFQFLFFAQWQRLRDYANAKGIGIIGDIPIFVALDSADVWANPSIFQLNERGLPSAVAGVPPDYFSPLGQLWGNPLFNWDKLRETGYAWWIARFKANFDLYDIIRLDHFRGFYDYWAIPAGSPDARPGQWKMGPGLDFFKALKKAMPHALIIAEDLGNLNDGVVRLRDETGLPGMAILQFAFGSGSDNYYLPHNCRPNSVMYPGTHDNDTSLGWYRSAAPHVQDEFRRYLRTDGHAANWDLVHASYKSVCNLSIVMMQDIMNLGSEARMNTPGTAMGNWQWRYTPEQLDRAWLNIAGHLRELCAASGRRRPEPGTHHRPKKAAIEGIISLPASSNA